MKNSRVKGRNHGESRNITDGAEDEGQLLPRAQRKENVDRL